VPRREFVDTVVAKAEAGARARGGFGRLGLALATSGLIVGAFAAFGGIGYASSAASQAVKKLENVVRSQPATRQAAPTSAAQAQYGPFKPPPTKPTKQTRGQLKTVKTPKPPTSAKTIGETHGLPFTGLSLWAPTLAGFALFAFGLALRRLGRRRSAH